MVTIIVNDVSIDILNPDNTVNASLAGIGGTPPLLDSISNVCLGQKLRLTIDCVFDGTMPGGGDVPFEFLTIRYNPAMFGLPDSVFYPVGAFPQGGYNIILPDDTPRTYTMRLLGQYENIPNNVNGTATLEVVTGKNFIITHEFRMTSDTETYLTGRSVENKFRLSKASQYSPGERSLERPSVYGNDRAINFLVCARTGVTNIFAPDISVGIAGSAFGFKKDGTQAIECAIEIKRNSVAVENLSLYENNEVTLIFSSETIPVTDEVCVVLVDTSKEYNVSTYESDYSLVEAKLLHAPSGSAQIAGPIYQPVNYRVSGSEKKVTFTIKGSELQIGSTYEIHVLSVQNSGGDDYTIHYSSGAKSTEGDAPALDFTVKAELHSRNLRHAERFTITNNERCIARLEMSRSEYDAAVIAPYTSFDEDIDTVKLEVYEEGNSASPVLTQFIQKNLDGTFPTNSLIETDFTTGPSGPGTVYFWLKEFRVPYQNHQSLPEWQDKTFVFKWSVLFKDQVTLTFSVQYVIESYLEVRNYETAEASPSSDVVSNINFYDPETGAQLVSWCDKALVLVRADTVELSTTKIAVMFDKYPYGVQFPLSNDLQEKAPHQSPLDPSLDFSLKDSTFIIDLDEEPTDGVISFLLDVSEMQGEDKYRIYIEAYKE